MDTIYIDFDIIKSLKTDNDNDESLLPYADFLDFYKKYNGSINFIVISRGAEQVLYAQKEWLEDNISLNIKFVGFFNDKLLKKFDFSNGIYISSHFDRLDGNAKIKMLYLHNNIAELENTDAMIINNWSDVANILDFYSKYDYDTLASIY